MDNNAKLLRRVANLFTLRDKDCFSGSDATLIRILVENGQLIHTPNGQLGEYTLPPHPDNSEDPKVTELRQWMTTNIANLKSLQLDYDRLTQGYIGRGYAMGAAKQIGCGNGVIRDLLDQYWDIITPIEKGMGLERKLSGTSVTYTDEQLGLA